MKLRTLFSPFLFFSVFSCLDYTDLNNDVVLIPFFYKNTQWQNPLDTQQTISFTGTSVTLNYILPDTGGLNRNNYTIPDKHLQTIFKSNNNGDNILIYDDYDDYKETIDIRYVDNSTITLTYCKDSNYPLIVELSITLNKKK